MTLFPQDPAEIRGDEADIANAHADQERERAIEAVRRNAERELEPNGTCWNCELTLAPEDDRARFCDADCRDDYMLREKMERQNG